MRSERMRGKGRIIALLAVFAAFAALLVLPTASAAVPKTLNIQGKLTYPNGSAITGNDINFSFSIYTASSGGSPIWQENHTLNVSKGIYDAILGLTNSLTLDFDLSYYLGIKVNDDSEMTPRINLTSFPYSYRTIMAENLTCTDCLGQTQIQDIYVLKAGDEMEGDLNITGNLNVTGSGYFGALYQAGTSLNSLFLQLAGGTMAGDLDMGGNSLHNAASLNATALYIGGGYEDADGGLTIDSQGNIFTDGSLTFSGDTYTANGQEINGSITPFFNDIFSLGNSSNNWLTIYGTNIYEGGTALSSKYLAKTGDTATGNYTFDSGTLFIDSVQDRVGIGTTSPLEKLDVADRMRLRTGSLGKAGIWFANTTASNAFIGLETDTVGSEKLGIYQNGWALIVDSTGKVGMNTTSPDQALKVEGNANVTGTLYADNVSSNSPLQLQTGGTTRIYINDTEGYVGIGETSPGAKLDINGTGLLLNVENAGTSYLAVNQTSGDVGIGVTDTQATLHVKEFNYGGLGPTIRLENGGAIEGDTARIEYYDGTLKGYMEWGTTASGQSLNFYDSVNSSSRLYIGGDGNVGIGTTSPTVNLVVNDSDNVHVAFVSSTGHATLQLFPESSGSSYLGYNNALQIGTETGLGAAVDTKMTLDSNGNVGIGTTSPNAKLEVSGESLGFLNSSAERARRDIYAPTSWSDTGAALPVNLSASQLAIIGDSVYLFGGVNDTNPISRHILRALVNNPTSWSDTGNTLPGNLAGSQLAVIGNYVYIFGGEMVNVVYKAPVSNPTSWSDTGATLPGILAGSQLAIIGDYVYLFGGWNGASAVKVIYRAPVSDPTSWSDTGSTLPGNLYDSQLAVIGDYVYLFGGHNGSSTTNVIYKAPVSNPTSWSNTGSTLPGNLGYSQLAVIGDYVYLFGGFNTPSAVKVIYKAPVSNPTSWSDIGSTLPGNLYFSQLAVIGDYVYLFGGHNSSGSSTNFIYRAGLKSSEESRFWKYAPDVEKSRYQSIAGTAISTDGKGNVGIGTTSPEYPLHISSSAPWIQLEDTSPAQKWRIGSTSGYLYFYDQTNTKTAMVIGNSTGNVGVNTTSPGVLLHVKATSDTAIFRLEDSDGTCDFNPESSGAPYSCSSDARLKANIRDAESTLDDLMKLRVRDYTVIASGEEKTGLVAQEVLDVMPELVSMGDDGYYKITEVPQAKLIKAIQEQEQRIEEQQEEIEALKAIVCKDHPEAGACG
jgi:hypothetical protein